MTGNNNSFDQEAAVTALREVSKAVQVMDIVPELALVQYRRTAEFVLRHIFEKEYGQEPGRIEFNVLLRKLRERGCLPIPVVLHFRTIQSWGNRAAHSAKASVPFTANDLRPTSASLFSVLEWFFLSILEGGKNSLSELNVIHKNLSEASATHKGEDETSVRLSPHHHLEVEPPAVERPVNLNLQGIGSDGMPMGWFNSVGFVSHVSNRYQISHIGGEGGLSAPWLEFFHRSPLEGEFGSLMQCCRADGLAGRTIRISARLKSEDVESWAGLWLRADGLQKPNLIFDNMSERPIKGTTAWTVYETEVQLPDVAVWLNYGVVLVGRGVLLVDHFTIQVRDKGSWRGV